MVENYAMLAEAKIIWKENFIVIQTQLFTNQDAINYTVSELTREIIN